MPRAPRVRRSTQHLNNLILQILHIGKGIYPESMSQQHERLADVMRSFIDHLGPVRGLHDEPLDSEWFAQLVAFEEDVLRELEAWELENPMRGSKHNARPGLLRRAFAAWLDDALTLFLIAALFFTIWLVGSIW